MDEPRLNHILKDIYRRLFDRYGPQQWWPAEEPFEVIIGAILTQSAAWTNVEKAIDNLRTAGALNPATLRRLPQEELARLIYSSGYHNAKARKLKAFAAWLGDTYRDNLGALFNTSRRQLRRELLEIHGIGEETADSIILYAAEKPVFVVDAYTRRIMERAGLQPAGDSYAAYQRLFMRYLPADAQLYNEYHALFVRLGKEVCRSRPLCRQCCLNDTPEIPPAEGFPCAAVLSPQR